MILPPSAKSRSTWKSAEAFNVFNRVRFGTGSLSLQDANFGKLASSGDLVNTPRQMQLGLKLYF
jgi:hypothetical protein